MFRSVPASLVWSINDWRQLPCGMRFGRLAETIEGSGLTRFPENSPVGDPNGNENKQAAYRSAICDAASTNCPADCVN